MFCWPSTRFDQVGEFASSKSAMKTCAPELSALITIFRSVGPVISTRRSCEVGRRLGDLPVALADVLRLREEVGHLAGEQALLPRGSRGEQLLAPAAERRAAASATNVERLGGEDALVALAAELDACREVACMVVD